MTKGFEIKVDTKELQRAFDKFGKEILAVVSRELVKGTNKIRTDTIKLLNTGQRGGRVYKRRGGIVHVASRKGEAPKSDTGRLANSITIASRPKIERNRVTGTVSAGGGTVNYAKKLEDEGRPYLSTSVEKNKDDITSSVRKAIAIIAKRV
jgi:hypothetical protein